MWWWMLGAVVYLIMGYILFCVDEKQAKESRKDVGWDDLVICLVFWWLFLGVLPFYSIVYVGVKFFKNFEPGKLSLYRLYMLKKERRKSIYKLKQS